MSDVFILDLGDSIKGNCAIDGYANKIIINSFSHGAYIPMANDAANTERTAGRPVLSEMGLVKLSDLSTTELFKACTRGTKLGTAKLHVGRVENGVYMNFMTYTLDNAMISQMNSSGGGATGIPADAFSINFTKIKADFTQQKTDSTAKGTGTWNWNLETMKAD
ncbi:Hcp family type VI secretion system effector [Pseudoduganella sp. R-34]|uniref:Hcp family type VI secretion system effector n=1 Tax=unclassified Pseudoduganella TaxID=2637179 RepID=UPI003CF2B913